MYLANSASDLKLDDFFMNACSRFQLFLFLLTNFNYFLWNSMIFGDLDADMNFNDFPRAMRTLLNTLTNTSLEKLHWSKDGHANISGVTISASVSFVKAAE